METAHYQSYHPDRQKVSKYTEGGLNVFKKSKLVKTPNPQLGLRKTRLHVRTRPLQIDAGGGDVTITPNKNRYARK